MRLSVSGARGAFGLFFIAGSALLLSAPAQAQEVAQIPTPPLTPAPSARAAGPSASLWVGGDVSTDSFAFGSGLTFALNGNLYSDGLLLRGTVGLGDYDIGPPGTPRAHFASAALLVGYQGHLGDVFVAGFAGPQLNNNSHGAPASVAGTQFNGLFTGEIGIPAGRVDLSAWGSYSTFQNQFTISGRALYRVLPGFRLGPQVAYSGGNTWHRGRVGGFTSIYMRNSALEIGGGYSWNPDTGAGEGVYGNMSLSFPF